MVEVGCGACCCERWMGDTKQPEDEEQCPLARQTWSSGERQERGSLTKESVPIHREGQSVSADIQWICTSILLQSVSFGIPC